MSWIIPSLSVTVDQTKPPDFILETLDEELTEFFEILYVSFKFVIVTEHLHDKE